MNSKQILFTGFSMTSKKKYKNIELEIEKCKIKSQQINYIFYVILLIWLYLSCTGINVFNFNSFVKNDTICHKPDKI